MIKLNSQGISLDALASRVSSIEVSTIPTPPPESNLAITSVSNPKVQVSATAVIDQNTSELIVTANIPSNIGGPGSAIITPEVQEFLVTRGNTSTGSEVLALGSFWSITVPAGTSQGALRDLILTQMALLSEVSTAVANGAFGLTVTYVDAVSSPPADFSITSLTNEVNTLVRSTTADLPDNAGFQVQSITITASNSSTDLQEIVTISDGTPGGNSMDISIPGGSSTVDIANAILSAKPEANLHYIKSVSVSGSSVIFEFNVSTISNDYYSLELTTRHPDGLGTRMDISITITQQYVATAATEILTELGLLDINGALMLRHVLIPTISKVSNTSLAILLRIGN